MTPVPESNRPTASGVSGQSIGAQIRLEDDGTFEIWVSAQDPGRANWLDTDGHRRGTVFWRYLLPEEDPELVTTEVVSL